MFLDNLKFFEVTVRNAFRYLSSFQITWLCSVINKPPIGYNTQFFLVIVYVMDFFISVLYFNWLKFLTKNKTDAFF